MSGTGMLETRDYQTRVIDKTLKAIDEGHESILIESPTGSGKTIMGHIIAQRLSERYGYKTGWMAMRKHLLVQAREENAKRIGFEGVEYFSAFTDQPPLDVDILIEDEAAHSAAPTSTQQLKAIAPKIHIGLTATPYRTDRMKLCFSRVIKDAGLRALIDQGYLSPYHSYIMGDEWTPRNVANVYLNDIDKWGKTVMFFLTENECDECAGFLRENNVKCEVVTGSSHQEEQIHMFNEGDVNVLLNMVVLTEGFDSPVLRTAMLRPGSKGPTVQMAGRAFRKHETKPFANIIQNSRTHWPFTKIASPSG
jgi:superfamily II DNA or RNA helicase